MRSDDSALSTWTLCTVPDVGAALQEVRRVLKPREAALRRALAPDANVRRWQRRLEPLQERVCGGCHLTRPIVDLLMAAGFAVADLDRFYEEGSPKVLGADVLGAARAG